MDQDLQIHLLVLVLCSYNFFINNLCLKHIVCVMTIVAVQLFGLAAIKDGRQIQFSRTLVNCVTFKTN